MFSEKYTILERKENCQLTEVLDKDGKRWYAKEISIDNLDVLQVNQLIRDLDQYRLITQDSANFASKSLLSLQEVIQEKEFIYVIMDYEEIIGDLNEEKILETLENLRHAIMYLHDLKIVHGNINIGNIFYGGMHCKLGILNVDQLITSAGAVRLSTSTYFPLEFKKVSKNSNSDLKSLVDLLKKQAKMHQCLTVSLERKLENLIKTNSANDILIKPLPTLKTKKKANVLKDSFFPSKDLILENQTKHEVKRPPRLTVVEGFKEFHITSEENIEKNEIVPITKRDSKMKTTYVSNSLEGFRKSLPAPIVKKKVSLQDIFSNN